MPGIGIGISNVFRGVGILSITPPTLLTAAFDVPTISGQVSWVDNSGGAAQYEVYSSYNGNPYVFLGTTLAGATSYIDTTCKQGAGVVYRIRGKKGGIYSEYVTTSTLSTPWCLKTNQSTLTTFTLNAINISAGSVTVSWGDGTQTILSGSNINVIKNYSITGTYDISLSGSINDITNFSHYLQPKTNGDITNWVIYPALSAFNLNGNSFTCDLSKWELSYASSINYSGQLGVIGDIGDKLLNRNIASFAVRDAGLQGNIPNIDDGMPYGGLYFYMFNNKLSGSNITRFKTGMTIFDIKNQRVVFPTTEVDKVFKAAADWYQLNPPTASCTYNLSGANMGIPTDGVSNVDIVRLIQIYTDAGRTATVLVRTT